MEKARQQVLVYVFLAGIAVLLLTGGVGAQGPCDAADALRKEKLYEAAQANYTELLKKDPKLPCAQAGIKELRSAQASEQFTVVRTLASMGFYKDASEKLKKVVEENPGIEVPEDLKALQNAQAVEQFAVVRTLAGMGLYTEAANTLKKVVEENPGIEVPEDLEYLSGGKISPWRWLKLQAEPWILSIGELVVAMLAMFVLYWRIYPWILGFFVLKLDIDDFDKGATELDIGKGLKAMVEESYKRFGSQMGHTHVHLIDAAPKTPQIPADVKMAPYLKIISDLSGWVFPQKIITLSGYIQKPGALGAGLTLTLTNSQTGEIVANHTIWQNDFEPTITQQATSDSKSATPYYRLTEPAAIWTLFQLAKQKKRYEFAPLGTQDWLSFAYSRAGALWALEGNKVNARQLYIEALSRDINRSALFNLGYLDIEDRNYDRGIERLSKAKELSRPYSFSWDEIPGNDDARLIELLKQKFSIDWVEKAKIEKIDNDKTIKVSTEGNSLLLKLNNEKTKVCLKIDDDRTDEFTAKTENGKLNIYSEEFPSAVWYVATYQLAAAYHYRSILLESKGDLFQSEQESGDLVKTIDAAIDKLQKKRKPSIIRKLIKKIRKLIKKCKTLETNEKELKQFLESIEPNACITHASILADQGEIKEAEEKVNSIKREYSKLTYRVHYNLACYYSILGYKYSILGDKKKSTDAYNQALKHLEYALERGGDIINWAQNDPSLQVRDEYLFCWDEIPGNYNKRFKEFLDRKYGIVWLKTAKIEKTNDNRTIRVFTEKNSLSLGLNYEKTRVNLKIDDGRTDNLIAKKKNSNLNIYWEDKTTKDNFTKLIKKYAAK